MTTTCESPAVVEQPRQATPTADLLTPEFLARERTRWLHARHRARQHLPPGAPLLSFGEWMALKTTADFRCARCGRGEPEVTIVLDHVVPLAAGGADTAENRQPLCVSCNSSKAGRTADHRGKIDWSAEPERGLPLVALVLTEIERRRQERSESPPSHPFSPLLKEPGVREALRELYRRKLLEHRAVLGSKGLIETEDEPEPSV